MVSCTIVIPTHNRDALLERSVRSALAACPADGEVLVVDDKSIVSASQVLAHLQDPRLTILTNTGAGGAANTRNLGVSHAAGEVVFFLDDDDEMVADYCARVLVTAGPSTRADWGFSSTVERRVGAAVVDALRTRRRLRRGVVPAVSQPRNLVAAMSDGFWIRRPLFLEVGGLDPEQTIDEDTDLCVRLLANSRCPWFEVDPGMVVYRGYMPAQAEGAQLTVATPVQRGLDCYRRTYVKNAMQFAAGSSMHWFLATRFVRRAVKQGRAEQARTFLDSVQPLGIKMALHAYFLLKRLVHSWRGIGST